MDVEDLRLAIYRSFASTGRCPGADGLAAELHAQPQDIIDGLAALAAARHVVLDGTGTAVVMAHPFAAVNLGFSVMGAGTLWWGGCAWDAFAIPHLVPDEPSVLVATTCPECSTPHAWTVGLDEPPTGDQRAHFLVPVAHMWDDVLHTCGNQRIYCNDECVGDRPGATFDLATLWRLARGWYAGRLDRGYQRREPAAAKDHFAAAGLEGEFWGLTPPTTGR